MSFQRWFGVAGVAVMFAAAGSRGTPELAWWTFAVTGAVLAIVDTKTHRLPARLVGPLAATETAIMVANAVAVDQRQALIRAGTAAVVVAAGYFSVAIILPDAIGLGDIYVISIASGLLGWTSWESVIVGQVLSWTLGLLIVGCVMTARRNPLSWAVRIPMGPAILAGSLVAVRGR